MDINKKMEIKDKLNRIGLNDRQTIVMLQDMYESEDRCSTEVLEYKLQIIKIILETRIITEK